MIMKTVHSVLDLLFPRRCAVCRRPLSAADRFLCTECDENLPLTYFWSMEENEMSRKLNAKVQELRDRERETIYEPYICATALFFYKGDYRDLTRAVKYRADLPLGRYLGQALGRRLKLSSLFEGIDVVVPVPLYRWRRFKRGYNQARIIAGGLAGEIGAGVDETLLVRRRNTKSQARLTVGAKASNVAGAFVATVGDGPVPRHILLVDDVFTTGSTMAECCRELRKALPDVKISVATLSCVGE